MTGISDALQEDVRGVCTAGIETAQTFLKPDQAVAMVEEVTTSEDVVMRSLLTT